MINYPIQLNTSEFQDNITEILQKHEVDEIIETGTFQGNGSTLMFAKTNRYVFTMT